MSEPTEHAIAERRPCPFDDFDERACRREQAEALGVSRRQVCRWRAGTSRLPVPTADRLAVATGHHPFELWPDTWGADR